MNRAVASIRSLLACLVVSCAADEKEGASPVVLRPEPGGEVTIVTLGTSLTGGRWPWPTVMMEWLDNQWPGQFELHNLGVGASASQTVPAMEGSAYIWKRCGLDRLDEAVALEPDLVFIEFAVNDAYRPYGISLEASRRNLLTMIDRFQASDPATKIVLQTMNPVIDHGGPHATDRPQLSEYSQICRDVAQERGLLLVDHYPNWLELLSEDRDRFLELVPDGIHPQLPGYRAILLPELKERLVFE